MLHSQLLMKATLRQFKQIFVIVCLLGNTGLTYAQYKSAQLPKPAKDFVHIAADANVIFTPPEGFKEISPINNEDLNYDYGMALPGKLEIWFSVMPYKYTSKSFSQPDSAYLNLSKMQVSAFSSDNDYFTRSLTAKVLVQYNADHGKSYLLNLNDSPFTRHYKYALILALQKDHIATVLAVCLTNDKGPELFKSMDKARNCLKFK